jgi:hypothetical protein
MIISNPPLSPFKKGEIKIIVSHFVPPFFKEGLGEITKINSLFL